MLSLPQKEENKGGTDKQKMTAIVKNVWGFMFGA